MEKVAYISGTAIAYLIKMKKDLHVTMLIMGADEKLMNAFFQNNATKLFDFIKNEKSLVAKERSRELEDILNDPGES